MPAPHTAYTSLPAERQLPQTRTALLSLPHSHKCANRGELLRTDSCSPKSSGHFRHRGKKCKQCFLALIDGCLNLSHRCQVALPTSAPNLLLKHCCHSSLGVTHHDHSFPLIRPRSNALRRLCQRRRNRQFLETGCASCSRFKASSSCRRSRSARRSATSTRMTHSSRSASSSSSSSGGCSSLKPNRAYHSGMIPASHPTRQPPPSNGAIQSASRSSATAVIAWLSTPLR